MKRQEAAESGMKKKELYNLWSPSNIIRMINSRRMKLAGHVAYMGEM
jgi:hypothetical protein